MNRYLKSFLLRGLIFAGFGPIICSIVFLFIHLSGVELALDAYEIFLAVVSTYVLAFVQAGASVFNQIDHWPLTRSLLCHFGCIYAVYVICYVINSWIPFEPLMILIFTAAFVVIYFIVWITVFLCVKAQSKKLNKKIG